MKKIFYWIVLAALPVFVLVVAGELYGAVYIDAKRVYRFDNEMGWAPKSNFRYNSRHSDIAGNTYDVTLTTNEYGFRQWGELGSEKPRILFIGDSVTGDPNMSDQDAYFGRVNALVDAEVFAIGGGGYGTLQELMVLRKYADIIDPDYFILQFCTNDFSNNSLYLESPSIVRNQKNLRPYLEGDRIVYRLPPGHWYRFLYRHSHIFRFLDRKLQIYQYNLYNGYTPPAEKDEVRIRKATISAEQITAGLLKMMANSVSRKTRLLAFTCSTKRQEDTERWMRVTESAGFSPLPAISAAVEKAEEEGVIVRASDGSHWGAQGHRIAGEVLAGELNRILNAGHGDNGGFLTSGRD